MKKNTSISKEDLKRYRALLTRSLWRELNDVFEQREKEHGISRSDLAARLGVDKSVVSRRLNGSCNMTLETLSDFARALECRPVIKITPYENLSTRGSNNCPHAEGYHHDTSSTKSTKSVVILRTDRIKEKV